MQTNKEMTKLYKVLLFIIAVSTVGGHIGLALYLPKRLEKLELTSSIDHDTLIEVKSDVKNINRKLENRGIVYNYNNPMSYEKINTTNMLNLNGNRVPTDLIGLRKN